jgi:hypothetical protein
MIMTTSIMLLLPAEKIVCGPGTLRIGSDRNQVLHALVQAVDFDCLSYPWHANGNPQECSRWPNTKTNTKA